MKKLAMYINGAFETGFTGQWRDVLNPATEEAIAQEPKGSGADVDRAVAAARAAQPAWERLVDKYQLAAPRELAAFIGQGATYADFQMNHGKAGPLPPVIMSSIKIRQAGFAACMDTEDMFRKWFGQLQERRLLPSAAQARAAG